MQERAALRTGVIRFGPFGLDVESGELRKGPTRLKVPDQSIEVLKALLERPGQLVTREELRQRLWSSETFVDFEAGLNAAVKRLRDALADSADSPRFIETMPRRGYRFIGAIEESATFPGTASVGGEAASGLTRRRYRMMAIAALPLVAGVGIWMAQRHSVVTAPLYRTVPVTTLPGIEFDPAISPDGNEVAYAWDGDGKDFNIYIKVIGEEGAQQITTNPAEERSPSWSPDGRHIAFLRALANGARLVVIVPARGGAERALNATETAQDDRIRYFDGVSWSSDGEYILFSGRAPGSTSATAIFACSIRTGEQHQLTFPVGFNDAQPVMSPNGRYLGFVRRVAAAWVGDVFVQRLEGLRPIGDAQRVTSEARTAVVAWTDDQSVIYDRYSEPPGLWRIAIDGRSPEPVLLNAGAERPSSARNQSRIVFQRSMYDANIWRIAGPARRDSATAAAPPIRVVDSTSYDGEPQLSRDGTRIAFVSKRSGSSDVWISSTDGASPPLQVTKNALAGSPRWSRDGETIAFDAIEAGSYHVYRVSAQGGVHVALTSAKSNDVRPTWSLDNRTIYFGSDRSGSWQIWKMDADGKNLKQVTKRGGLEAFESPDGRFLYYAKSGDVRGIWRIPTTGGEELQITDHGMAGYFGVTDRGIVLMDRLAQPSPTIEFFDETSARLSLLRSLPPGSRIGRGATVIAVSQDGQWIVYSQADAWGSDIQMLEPVK